MSLNLEEKKAVVAEVSEQIKSAQALILAEYRGVGVTKLTDLRSKARESGVYLRVLKNTLVKRAIEGTPFADLSGDMTGPLIFGMSEDPVAVAKVLNNFAKENDLFVIKSGALPNEVMDGAKIKALASLPSREELLAKLMGTMQAPIAKFVRTLNEVPTKFVRAVAARIVSGVTKLAEDVHTFKTDVRKLILSHL